MTPPREEIVSSLEGAWGLARRDPAALQRFNLSVDGFWNSFYAAVICAPGYLLLVAQQYVQRGSEAGAGTIIIVETLAYAIGWLVFLYAITSFCRLRTAAGSSGSNCNSHPVRM